MYLCVKEEIKISERETGKEKGKKRQKEKLKYVYVEQIRKWKS